MTQCAQCARGTLIGVPPTARLVLTYAGNFFCAVSDHAVQEQTIRGYGRASAHQAHARCARQTADTNINECGTHS